MSIYNATEHEISIKADTFEGFRTDFDTIINQALDNMREQGLNTADVTVKFTIETTEREVENPMNANERRKAVVPTFKHKISCVLKHESKIDGAMADNRELVWDEVTGKYVLVDIQSAQVDMFNGQHTYGDRSQVYYADGEVTEAYEPLPAPSTYLPEGAGTAGDGNDGSPAF